ncbi:histidine phosphatase family protein [Micromonospora sp. NPDC050695]|uniref:histidine phosphatase family protein n=1 Tax=Micromonospora sp. NPDC050695 TaxID=3154938 RepID=UPI0033C7D1E1
MITRLLYLARHGEQDLTEMGEPAVAEPDTGLTERGRRQATLLGERLRGHAFTAVHHGPLRRAAETARLVAASLPGVPVYETELAGDHLPQTLIRLAFPRRTPVSWPSSRRPSGPTGRA